MPGRDRPPAIPAEIVAYDENWPVLFRQVAVEVSRALAGIEHDVEHIGSTSVRGLVAKPIIDLFAVLNSVNDVPIAIDALDKGGWHHEGNRGLSGRESFTTRPDLPYHHLYLVVRGNEQYRRQTRFRDILRHDAKARAEYVDLKLMLAPLLVTDRAAYADGKTEFVVSVLTRHGFDV